MSAPAPVKVRDRDKVLAVAQAIKVSKVLPARALPTIQPDQAVCAVVRTRQEPDPVVPGPAASPDDPAWAHPACCRLLQPAGCPMGVGPQAIAVPVSVMSRVA